jgi:hypothetical protein
MHSSMIGPHNIVSKAQECRLTRSFTRTKDTELPDVLELNEG